MSPLPRLSTLPDRLQLAFPPSFTSARGVGSKFLSSCDTDQVLFCCLCVRCVTQNHPITLGFGNPRKPGETPRYTLCSGTGPGQQRETSYPSPQCTPQCYFAPVHSNSSASMLLLLRGAAAGTARPARAMDPSSSRGRARRDWYWDWSLLDTASYTTAWPQ